MITWPHTMLPGRAWYLIDVLFVILFVAFAYALCGIIYECVLIVRLHRLRHARNRMRRVKGWSIIERVVLFARRMNLIPCLCGHRATLKADLYYEEAWGGRFLAEYACICAKCGRQRNVWAYGTFEKAITFTELLFGRPLNRYRNWRGARVMKKALK